MSTPSGGETPATVYETLGGAAFFGALAARFYEGVATDPVLRPLYPDDMTDAEVNLREFLIQYWGGPDDYSRRRGHPMLRARHLPFTIGRAERDAWMNHMAAAVRSSGAPAELATELLGYFERAATHLMNVEPPQPGHLPIVPGPSEFPTGT
jgi:hemoglobin